jgi:TetR/AcrR family transcriptional regulator, tetracycline repressor protein
VALDRTHVVKTALTLLDEVGLDGLSLRRLAKELGVQAPALYWHFKNKQELLDQMIEELARLEAPLTPPAAGEPWDEWLTERARQLRRALNSHRDGAMLAASTHPPPGQWSEIEMQLDVLCTAGLTAAEAMYAMIALGNYVSGFTLEEQADRLRGDDPKPDPEQFDEMLTALRDYPLATRALREVGDPQSDDSFEAGLQMIMDGLRKRVADHS